MSRFSSTGSSVYDAVIANPSWNFNEIRRIVSGSIRAVAYDSSGTNYLDVIHSLAYLNAYLLSEKTFNNWAIDSYLKSKQLPGIIADELQLNFWNASLGYFNGGITWVGSPRYIFIMEIEYYKEREYQRYLEFKEHKRVNPYG